MPVESWYPEPDSEGGGPTSEGFLLAEIEHRTEQVTELTSKVDTLSDLIAKQAAILKISEEELGVYKRGKQQAEETGKQKFTLLENALLSPAPISVSSKNYLPLLLGALGIFLFMKKGK